MLPFSAFVHHVLTPLGNPCLPLHPHTHTFPLSSAAYPLSFIDNLQPDGRGGHASSVVMLTCDAFGVLPAISKLTPEQAEYWFLLGYTAKVAGTEKGVDGVQATFSTCFGQVSLSRTLPSI